MLHLKWIEENPQALDQGLQRRGEPPRSHVILKYAKERKATIQALETLRHTKKQASDKIAQAIKNSPSQEVLNLKQEVATLKEKITHHEKVLLKVEATLHKTLSALPNIPLDEVPEGANEKDNRILETWGDIPSFDFPVQAHDELALKLGGIDFEKATQIARSRFVVLKGSIARLERALGQFMLDTHTQEFGYEEVSPPLLANTLAMFGTSQLPKFAYDQFSTQEDLWLIPTGEVPLTNLGREEVFEEAQLPLRFVALTSCFRKEAGATGRDTRGIMRQHQFPKVELVSLVAQGKGLEEHERMTNCARAILEKLKLPYRVVYLCCGDMGFSSQKTFDLEVWIPSENTFREISSCSLCGTFQARRMQARYKSATKKEISFLNTLNGSALAVGRTLIAVLENYQNANGEVNIPEVLRPYMAGEKKISHQAS